MTIRERLFEILELNSSKVLAQMRDDQQEDYIRKLNSFIANFPDSEEALKSALAENNYLAFSKMLAFVRDLLTGIFADELAEECQKQINALAGVNHEKFQASLTYLLSLMAMLSIDIQVAIYMDENDGNRAPAGYETVISGEQSTGKKTILAVDDNAISLDALTAALGGETYELANFRSGFAALEYLKDQNAELFILDIEMPEIDGFRLAYKIRELGKAAPIIFLTGNATREYILKALNAGAADFIIKPFTQKLILKKVEKFIRY